MMDVRGICRLIEYTNLNVTLTFNGLVKMISEANEYNFHGICILPIYVRFAKEVSNEKLKIITVISFPHGASPIRNKIMEAEKAINDGADELDFVSYIGYLFSYRFDLFYEDIKNFVEYIKTEYPDITVKVIVDLPYLNGMFKQVIANIINRVKPDFFKTSTGRGPRPTTIEDIKTYRKLLHRNIGIKAAGGIRRYNQVVDLIKTGASRIGTSAAIQIIKEAMKLES